MRLALANSLSAHRPPPVGGPLSGIIAGLGLTDGLKLCQDWGDINSWPGSGQKILDTSGNGYDFNLGATDGAEASDPTPTGTPGALGAGNYAALDGGDYLTYEAANEAWMDNLHKADVLATILCWLYPAGSTNNRYFGNNGGGALNVGVDLNAISSTGNLVFRVGNGSGTFGYQETQNVGVTNAAWQMLAVSINEAANTGVMARNGTAIAITPSYTSPSAAAATRVTQIGAIGNNVAPLPNGARKAIFAAWEGVALSAAQIASVFAATRGRFGV